MQLVRPPSEHEFITKSGAVFTMFEFVGLPFEQMSPAACVPQYMLIGTPPLPLGSRALPSLAAPEFESQPLAPVSTRYRVGALRHAFNGC